MLAIQVAAGILLAYVVIANQKKLLLLGRWLIGFAIIIIVGAVLIWAGVLTVNYAGAHLSTRFWRNLFEFLVIIPLFFVLAASAGVGILALATIPTNGRPTPATLRIGKWLGVSKTKKDGGTEEDFGRRGCLAVVLALLVIGGINELLSFPVWAYTPVGRWYDQVDAYGRANGWDDGLTRLIHRRVIFGLADVA